MPDEIPRIFLGLSKTRKEYIHLSRHALSIAGSRTGKGSCQIIPNLLEWQESAVVIDPRGEAARETARFRRDVLGQEVVVFDPFNYASGVDDLRKPFNPLDTIEGIEDIRNIADGLILRTEHEKEPHWNDCAQQLLEGVIALVLSSDKIPDEARNLITVSQYLEDLADKTPLDPGNPKGPTRAGQARQTLRACNAFGGLARKAAVMLAENNESQSFHNNLTKQTNWLTSPDIQKCFGQSSDVDFHKLKRGKMTIYLVIPPDYLLNYGRFLKVFTAISLSVMWRKMPDGKELGTHCLFILDEFPALGRLDKMRVEALPIGAGYGLHAWPFCQLWGQLEDIYGKSGADAFLAACDAFCVYGLDDRGTPQLVSELMGKITPDEIAGLRYPHFSSSNSGPTPTRPLPSASSMRPLDPQNGGGGSRHEIALGRYERYRDEAETSRRDAESRRQAADQNALHYAQIRNSVAMARIGTPRMAPDQVAQETGLDQQLKHARAMLVRKPGNRWLKLTPHPYYRPLPVRQGSGALIELAAAAGLAVVASLLFEAVTDWGYWAELLGFGMAFIFLIARHWPKAAIGKELTET